jgi:hypothetical protein
MAIAIHTNRRHVTHRPPMMRARPAESNAALPLVMVVLLTIGITGLLLSSQILEISVPRSLIPTWQRAAPSRPTEGATPVAKTATTTMEKSTESPAAPPAPVDASAQPASVTPALAAGARARVANTDNRGVVFYAAPRDNARQPAGLLEGTTVTVLEVSGEEWARVQSDAKKSGWVRAAYLAPVE